jgi:hypothetical protein
MFKMVTLAGAVALSAMTPALAQYAYLPPGYCAYDAYGNLVPCDYDYGYGGGAFFGAPFFFDRHHHRHFIHHAFIDHRFGHGFVQGGGFRGGPTIMHSSPMTMGGSTMMHGGPMTMGGSFHGSGFGGMHGGGMGGGHFHR